MLVVSASLQSTPCLAADTTAVRSGSGAPLTRRSAVLAPSLLEAPGTSIGEVTIASSNIFDLDDPEEDKALFRLANRFHAMTRENVIKQQLLFSPGEPFSASALAESERIIRANRYIQEVSIQPVRQENGVVDVNVVTSDAWTLIPKLAFSRSGGETNVTAGIKEMNLLGTGAAIDVLFKSDVDRDSKILKYRDRNLGNSWYGLHIDYADNSDGYSRFMEIGKPFYSLNSRSAQAISVLNRDSIETFYNRGEVASEYREQASTFEVYRGWSTGLQHGWTRRYTAGLVYDEHRFAAVAGSEMGSSVVPQDRQLLTPFVGIEIVEDHYDQSRNYDQINRIEDRYLGTRMSARLGVARGNAGSDRDAWILEAAAQTGFGGSENSSLILASALAARVEQGGVQNLTLDLNATYYKRQSERRLLYVSLGGTHGHKLDLDQYLELGGDSGLRGYPLRFQTGDKRALLTIEQRYFTKWYPFRLFHVGGAAFLDIGRTWGDGPLGASESQLLKNVGLGLRIAGSRSGLGRMVHVDLALPLDDNDDIDDVQLLVSTRKSF